MADGLGEYYAPSLWSAPIHTFYSLLAQMGITFDIQTKLLGFFILILGFWGIWKLLDRYGINDAGKGVGGAFFLLNSFFILLFDGGQLSLALAYSAVPAVILYFSRATEGDSLKDKLKLALTVLLLSIFDIRIVYLVLLVFILFFVFVFITGFKRNFSFLKQFFLSGFISATVLLGFHAFWLLPAFYSGGIHLPLTYGRSAQVNFLSFSSLSHSLLFQQPHWPGNVFGRVAALNAEFILIPLAVFSVLFLVKKNIDVAFWLLVAVLSIFLSKGSNEPFGQIYTWLFRFVPGFSLFRDPTKFFFLTSLSYSILLGFVVRAVLKRKTTSLIGRWLVKGMPVVLILYFIFLVRPLYLNQMSGMFSFPQYMDEFKQLGEVLKEDRGFSRVFWIPRTAPLGYVSTTHPAVGASGLSQKRPFAVGIKGTYETFNFLREAPYMGEIFDVAGIGYIAYPYLDSRRDDMHPDNIKYFYTFLEQLLKRPWLAKVDNSPIPLLKTAQHQDRFFTVPNIWWVIGSDSIYNEATKSANLKLAKNALIFVEEYPGLGKRIDEVPEAKVLLESKTNLDLAASFIDSSELIFPARNLNFQPDQSGWWKREAVDLVWWRSFLQEKYGINNQDFDLGGGWAVGEGNLKFEILNLKFKKDKLLLVRVMESSRSGSLKFYQGDKLIGEVPTKINTGANVRWFEIGKLVDDSGLEIITEGDINVVNALVTLDEADWAGYQNKARQLKDQGRVVSFDEKNVMDSGGGEVSYQQINPTKYKVRVEGLERSSMLVFSQNYNNLWKINGQTPLPRSVDMNVALPVYSLLNGFRIDHDGEYIIEFEAQKYVYSGLMITGITVILFVLFIVKSLGGNSNPPPRWD